jgi:plastocyanin
MKHVKREQSRAVALGLLALLISAHAGNAGEIVKVTISDLAFSPAEITVKVGDTVEWVNKDFIDHTATATNGDWDVAIPAGQSAGQLITKTGTISYFCRAHPDMTGKIRAD